MSDILSQAATSAESTESTPDNSVSNNVQDNAQNNQQSQTKKKFRAKVDGREEEFELDLSDEKAIADLYSKGKAANKRFEEAAKIRKEYDQFKNLFSQLQQDPDRLVELASNLGHDFDSLAEKRLLEKIRLENMPEHERKLYDSERKNKDYEDKLQKYERLEKEKQQAYELEQAENQLKSEMDQVLNNIKERDPYAVYRALELMRINEGLSFKDAWNKVDGQHKEYRKNTINSITDEDLANLSEETWKKIRAYDVNRIKSNSAFKTVDKSPEAKQSKQQVVSVDDWFKQQEERFRRK